MLLCTFLAVPNLLNKSLTGLVFFFGGHPNTENFDLKLWNWRTTLNHDTWQFRTRRRHPIRIKKAFWNLSIRWVLHHLERASLTELNVMKPTLSSDLIDLVKLMFTSFVNIKSICLIFFKLWTLFYWISN